MTTLNEGQNFGDGFGTVGYANWDFRSRERVHKVITDWKIIVIFCTTYFSIYSQSI